MNSHDPHNPRITRLLRWVTALEVGVLVGAGGGLFLLPDVLGPVWPWALTPFNARFLGGVYLASLVSAAALAYVGRWSPARLVVPMIFTFTVIVLGVSVAYLHRFTQSTASTLAWFALYIVIPANALYHLRLYGAQAPLDGARPGAVMRVLLLIQAVVLGGYGMLLLVAPQTFGAFWPWPLDDFHARLYSVTFLTPALGAGLLLRAAPPLELRTLGLTQIAGVLPLVGVLMVDATAQRIDWSAPGALLWAGLFIAIFLMGGLLLWQGRPQPVLEQPGAGSA